MVGCSPTFSSSGLLKSFKWLLTTHNHYMWFDLKSLHDICNGSVHFELHFPLSSLTERRLVPGDLIMSCGTSESPDGVILLACFSCGPWNCHHFPPNLPWLWLANDSTGRCDGGGGPEGGSNGVIWLRNSWSRCIPLLLSMRPVPSCLFEPLPPCMSHKHSNNPNTMIH